jgi:hypothetical protein
MKGRPANQCRKLFAPHVRWWAQAFFSSVSSGMMALTGMLFAIAFVIVQFSALGPADRFRTTVAAGTHYPPYAQTGVATKGGMY